MKIYPICSESLGVRSFCIKIKTPDCSILLDPGCALGPYKKLKIPHRLEFEKLQYFTSQIIEMSTDCEYLFISHYHHDHFKPKLEDTMYIQSNQKLFESLYTNKTVFCKQYQNKTNYNQKQRGVKLYKDLSSLVKRKIRIGVDTFTNNWSIYQRKCSIEVQAEIVDSAMIGDTHLLFPREFSHGMRFDGKDIFVQPIIIGYHDEFMYFFPDVQGVPSPTDCELILNLRREIEQVHTIYISKNPSTHIIALGGPITYLLRSQNLLHLLNQTLEHSQAIVQSFDLAIIDHHLLRDPIFLKYWEGFQNNKKNIILFNPDLIEEIQKEEELGIPVVEFNRERLYQQYP